MSLAYGFCLGDMGTEYDSAQFSDAFHDLVGDGITRYGAQFALTVGGFNATVASGYALSAGRWVENDEPYILSVPLPENNKDRTDALVVRVDYAEKKAALEVLVNVDEAAIKADPSVVRGASEYSVVLYFIRVRRGATSLSVVDVTDVREDNRLCGYIKPLSELSESVLYVHRYLTSGIDQEVSRLTGLSEAVIQRADAALKKLDADIKALGGAEIGELMTSRFPPAAVQEWLLCDGGAVPAEYPELFELLGGVLPDAPVLDSRFKTYIYGGKPVEV